ncbi:hypothetical protein EI534_03710 [Pseudomonas frederiksbergensis]|nr:hypothetical protein [Pseudomonas frederiksbergensis]
MHSTLAPSDYCTGWDRDWHYHIHPVAEIEWVELRAVSLSWLLYTLRKHNLPFFYRGWSATCLGLYKTWHPAFWGLSFLRLLDRLSPQSIAGPRDRQQKPKAGLRFRYPSISRACEITSPSISLKGRLMTSTLAVSDILGPWSGDAPTGLIQRCREAWDTPLESLNDLMVATFLNQNIATKHLLIEAKRRIKDQERDETEYFDGQLLEAIERLQSGE